MYNLDADTITATKARAELPELLDRAKRGGERIIIARHGRPAAALISYADLRRYQALEAARDLEELRKAKSENSGFVTLEEYQAKRRSRKQTIG